MEFTWNIDPVLFRLGPLQFRYYGLLFLGVFLGGLSLFRWQVVRGGGTARQGEAILVPGVVAVLLGARLGHVFFYEAHRIKTEGVLWIFEFWKGGLASHGATIGLIVGLAWWARWQKQSYIETLDRISFSVALATILVRIGNFFNSEIVGRLTDQTWGVRLPRHDLKGAAALADSAPAFCWGPPCGDNAVVKALESVPLRHPSQLYEVALGLGLLGVLWLTDRLAGGEKRPRGLMISVMLAFYFTGRFLVEFFKEYQTLSADKSPFTMGQYLSIPVALTGMVGIALSLKYRRTAQWSPGH